MAGVRRKIGPHEVARRAKGLTITEMAARLGLSRAHVSFIEAGLRQASPAYRAKAAALLDVTEDELFPTAPQAAA